jgi:hypothetical protein
VGAFAKYALGWTTFFHASQSPFDRFNDVSVQPPMLHNGGPG